MSLEEESNLSWIIRHWYVWLVLLAVGVAIGIGQSAGPTPDGVGAPSPENLRQDELQAKFNAALAKKQETEATPVVQSTDDVIAAHQTRLDELEASPDPVESATLLNALGNLHKQKKRDNATAARYFEQVIERYPEWPGINATFHQLISCYTQLEDQESLRLLYRKMVTLFPEESKEYEYAQAALAGEIQ